MHLFNPEVLHLMRRRYERTFAEKVQEIKTLIPDTFSGGRDCRHAGEKHRRHSKMPAQFIAGLDVSQLHVFPYSERSGTKSSEYPVYSPQAEKTSPGGHTS